MSLNTTRDLALLDGPGHQPGLVKRQALTNAPVGAYPLLEAAFGWSERRPLGWRDQGLRDLGSPSVGAGADRTSARGRYVPIVETDTAEAAARFARLLPCTTWAMVVDGGRADTARTGAHHQPIHRVEVPAASYHRLLRLLNGAWLDCRKLMTDPASAARHRQVAVGMWRMAILIAGLDVSLRTVAVRVSGPKVARALAIAGEGLQLSPSVRHEARGGFTLLITQRNQVSRLLAEAVDPQEAHHPR